MRGPRRNGSFWFCLMINLLLNLEWSIPAWILLAMHYILAWPIGLFWLALGLWIAGVLMWMFLIGWASDCSSEPDQPKENKNPYSVKNKSHDP